MKKMSDYLYHIGMRLRTYPSYQQKRMIHMNGGASRFVYSRLVAVHTEMFHLEKTAKTAPVDARRLAFLKEAYSDARHMKNAAPFLWDCDSDMVLHAMRNYAQAWRHFWTTPGARIPAFHKKEILQSVFIKINTLRKHSDPFICS